MKLSVWFIVILHFVSSAAAANDYIVELHCVAFDAHLPSEQLQAITNATAELPQNERGGARGRAQIDALRAQANILHESTMKMRLNAERSFWQSYESKEFITEVSAQILEENADSCKLDLRWGAMLRGDEGRSASLSVLAPRVIRFGSPDYIASTATNNASVMFRVTVRKATVADINTELSRGFGEPLNRRR